jgi:hypothetical protein
MLGKVFCNGKETLDRQIHEDKKKNFCSTILRKMGKDLLHLLALWLSVDCGDLGYRSRGPGSIPGTTRKKM